jgi:acetyl-CoA synthetase
MKVVKVISVREKNLSKKPNLENYEKVRKDFDWKEAEKELEWWPGRKLNAAYNAIDRHLEGSRKNKVALYWAGPEGEREKYTFKELAELSNQFGNFIKTLGVGRGDRVFFFLPRIPELFFGFLGTAKVGAIAGTLFSAFGPQALFDRLENSQAKVVVTTAELKKRLDQVKPKLPYLKYVVIVDEDKPRGKGVLPLKGNLGEQSKELKVARTKATDPAFMLYTSGTTGKPKGVIHQHRAVVQEHMTAKWVLDIKEEDVYWCTADPGWVTGIAYEILGTWSNGASSLVYAGRFNPETWYKLIEEYKVNIWYTAPTAVRMLMASKVDPKDFDLSSLRHTASVGEPLNPEAVMWGKKILGLPFHDNWWQTETGAMMIANYPCLPIKPGSMGKPFPGVEAGIVDDEGKELGVDKIGNLAARPGWPSMMKTIWRRPKKYQSYFVNNWYISGDLAYRDKDGYFWFVGRDDDVIKTAGERVGPFEVESALVEHPAVAEAGVIGKPDPMRGHIIKAFVALKPEFKTSEKLKKDLMMYVKKNLAGHAYPREIEFMEKLPKTRSGKIVRRILKAKELGLPVGDTSTLEEF